MNEKDNEELQKRSEKIGIENSIRHVFLCAGPKCIDSNQGDKIWNHLKKITSEYNAANPCTVMRTKVNCLRICRQGPLAVVYPEGLWIKDVDENICNQIVENSLLNRQMISENVFIEKKL